MQDLKAHGFNCDILSVDRVDSNSKICLPYQYFKSTIYEKNIEIYKTDLLTEEVVNLERDGNGRIDHPMGGTIGSKDISDAVCGAVFTASKHAEEYAYDYGENYDSFLDVNESTEIKESERKRQLMVDFEKELKGFDPMANKTTTNNQNDITPQPFVMDGIVI